MTFLRLDSLLYNFGLFSHSQGKPNILQNEENYIFLVDVAKAINSTSCIIDHQCSIHNVMYVKHGQKNHSTIIYINILETHVCIYRPVRRGGSRGFGRTPFFGWVYILSV